MEIHKIRDAQNDIWTGNDEIGWTLEGGDEDDWLRNRNQLFVIWGPLTDLD